MQKGVEYVPARLKQKRPKGSREEIGQGAESKRSNSVWEPSTSDEEHRDSEDSMSDLYPRLYIQSLHIYLFIPTERHALLQFRHSNAVRLVCVSLTAL